MSCRAAGFTLIEVLIALLVLAIGMVGAACAHIAMARMRHEAALMTMALQIANSASERILNNTRFRHLYMGFDYDAERDGNPVSAPGCHGTPCSGAALAAFDLAQLRHLVRASFPGGRMVICREHVTSLSDKPGWNCDGGAHSPIVIKIGWIERGPFPAHGSMPALSMLAGVPP